MANSDEVLKKLEEMGILDTAVRALNKQVDGDQWKEKYIPIISLSIALISVIAAPILTWYSSADRLESEILEHERLSFYNFCVKLEELRIKRPGDIEDYLKIRFFYYKIRDRFTLSERRELSDELETYALVGDPVLLDLSEIERKEYIKTIYDGVKISLFQEICRTY